MARLPYESPTPVVLPQPSRTLVARRLAQTLAVSSRHLGAAAAARLTGRAQERAFARALRRTFEDLGATYVKLGQFVASAPAAVSEAVSEEFRACLDRGPRVPFREVRAVVEAEIGCPLEHAFATFERKPMAAASIAVVHRATLKDGRPVAVKVLRPGLGEVVAADLDIMLPFFRFLARQGADPAFNLVSYLVGLREQLTEELDLRNEARAMDHFRELYAYYGLDLLVIPQVEAQLSGERVLTMEYLDGAAIDDLAAVEGLGLDPAGLVQELLRAWVLTGVHSGIFHADIHAGNLLALPDGRLGMLDWGIVARLDPDSHLMIKSVCEAAAGDESAWPRVTSSIMKVQGPILQEAMQLSDEEIAYVIRSMTEPLLTRPLREVSMADLFAGSQELVRRARGEEVTRTTLIERVKLNRRRARVARLAMADGYHDTGFQRSNFLASKQLLYLERYGRMYVPEHAILGDTEFLERALAWHEGEGSTAAG